MLLKRLEISGFKSFAKTVTLEFPTKIVAIVGPNGSGKSNIADAIRWVLGEQSMKHLRGKKGEDLIFGGTQQTARMSKASVTLVLDNKKQTFPVEFDEVAMSRKVYRDGINEYLLNGSQVRLKDIIELLSKVGLGASQHHIIAQGDADRILYASPKERKSMVEESLALKIFELKKNEAARKLASTEENIKQVESLRREIQPHLKYLKAEADKMRNAASLRQTLDEEVKTYVARELKTLAYEKDETEKAILPLEKKIKELAQEVEAQESSLSGQSAPSAFFEDLKKIDYALEKIYQQRRELERELGRLEAAAGSAYGDKKTFLQGISKDKVKAVLMELVSDLESVSNSGTMESVRNTIFTTTQKIYRFLESINGGDLPADKHNDVASYKVKEAILRLETEEKALHTGKVDLQKKYESQAAAVQKNSASLRLKIEELASLKESLRNFVSKLEKVASTKKEFEIDFSVWISGAKPSGDILVEKERIDIRRKIERLKIRLEEAGGVDENVLKEYEETKQHDEFLAKELEDLKSAANQLRNVFEELEGRIEQDFEKGLEKINKLFGEFFNEIFGGGRAEIKMQKPEIRRQPRSQADEEKLEESWQEEIEEEPGLDIFVDIPRKRIKSLAMLSGGERALTSIALLFAMSTVNPPPFLVLDETDAALDEANSNRYSSMLKELGKKTQLIVVTHNRETMKAADVLYGVTMGGDGISKLLSIKFEEAEDVLAKRK